MLRFILSCFLLFCTRCHSFIPYTKSKLTKIKSNYNVQFHSNLFTLITTKYNIFYKKKKLNAQSNLFSDFTFYGRSA